MCLDGIYPLLLRKCALSLSNPMIILLDKSIESSTVPAPWQISNVSAIFKKGAHSEPLSYRPISLRLVCSKTLEKMVAKHLFDYLEENNV